MRKIIIVLLLMGICGIANAEWVDDMREKIVELEMSSTTREMLNQFPFLQILDDWLCITSGIRIFECLDKRTGEKYDVFYRYWDSKWIKRYPAKSELKYPDDPYTFEDLE